MTDNQDYTFFDDVPEETLPDQNEIEVYEESEEGVAYAPIKPGSEQKIMEAEKILKKKRRDEQA